MTISAGAKSCIYNLIIKCVSNYSICGIKTMHGKYQSIAKSVTTNRLICLLCTLHEGHIWKFTVNPFANCTAESFSSCCKLSLPLFCDYIYKCMCIRHPGLFLWSYQHPYAMHDARWYVHVTVFIPPFLQQWLNCYACIKSPSSTGAWDEKSLCGRERATDERIYHLYIYISIDIEYRSTLIAMILGIARRYINSNIHMQRRRRKLCQAIIIQNCLHMWREGGDYTLVQCKRSCWLLRFLHVCLNHQTDCRTYLYDVVNEHWLR